MVLPLDTRQLREELGVSRSALLRLLARLDEIAEEEDGLWSPDDIQWARRLINNALRR